jgi:hypothetical protein
MKVDRVCLTFKFGHQYCNSLIHSILGTPQSGKAPNIGIDNELKLCGLPVLLDANWI